MSVQPAVRLKSRASTPTVKRIKGTASIGAVQAATRQGVLAPPKRHPRRTPTMQAFVNGQTFTLQEHQAGPLTSLPNLPTQLDAATTAAYIQSVMTGAQPVPAPIAQQVAHILQLVESL